jgi:hypothetical protein
MKKLFNIVVLSLLLQGCSILIPFQGFDVNEARSVSTNAPNRYLGIAPISKYSPLPEVAKDCDEMARFYASKGYETQIICDTVLSSVRILEKLAWITNANKVVILYSGHGTFVEKDYAFFLGDLQNVWTYNSFHEKFLTPISQNCNQGTFIIDSCFSGYAIPRSLGTNFVKHLNQKTLSEDFGSQPSYEFVNHPRNNKLQNFCIITAVGKNDVAEGQFISRVRGGWDSYDSCGMSMFSFCLGSQLTLSSWMEYVAEYNAKYFHTKGTWRKVQEVFNAVDKQQYGFVMNQASGRWIATPPRTRAHIPQKWIGKKHDGNIW